MDDEAPREAAAPLQILDAALPRRVFFINSGYVFRVVSPPLSLNSQQREQVALKMLRALQLAKIYACWS